MLSKTTRTQEKWDALKKLGNKELLERVWSEIKLLCGSDGPPKRWQMTIPVDADRDSDVLFGEVLSRFVQLEAEKELLVKFIRGVRHNDYWEDYQKLPEDIRRRIEVGF